ncbi:MAG: glycosyltransferase family A protein [Gemmatimonadota bacterium]
MTAVPHAQMPLTGSGVASVSVSVIVPAYGHADYILTALESALSQSPPPREVIVIDDSSPDDTAARLQSLRDDGRIRYVHQPNAGMAAARNAGARLATSDYLYFLDDDDLIYPGALAWLVEELDQNPDAAIAFGDKIVFSGEPPMAPSDWSDTRAVDPTRFSMFNQLGSPGQALIRRSAFNAAGGFDAGIWGTDDWDLWLRLLERYPARSAKRPVLAYRLHANNASRNVARMYESSLRVARRHFDGMNPDRRTILRRVTYGLLRQHHVPLLQQMFAGAVREREWAQASAALRAWTVAWATEIGASVRLKAHLLRRRRWTLPPDDPLTQAIVQR